MKVFKFYNGNCFYTIFDLIIKIRSIKCSWHFLTIVCCTLLASSCNKSKEKITGIEFAKIYDTDSAEATYYPIDIKETADHGFVLLGRTGTGNTILLRTDQYGHKIWFKVFPEYNTHGTALLEYGPQIYFCVSNFSNTTSYLLKVDDAGQTADIVKSFQDNLLLFASAKTGDNGLLLHKYDNENDKTVLVKLNAAFDLDYTFDKDGQKEYEVQISTLIEDRINKYIQHQGESLPFFAGQLTAENGGYFYFNGMYKTDLSLLMVDTQTGAIVKRLTGNRFQKCISSFIDAGNKKIGFTMFESSTNKISPSILIDSISMVSSNSDYAGAYHAELVERSIVKSKKMIIKGKELMVFLASTKTNQIGLYAYSLADGKLQGVFRFGHTHPYVIGNFIETHDGGLAVLCQTFVSGMYPRLALFKLSQSQLEACIN